MQTNKPWRAAASALLAVGFAFSGAGVANAADIPPPETASEYAQIRSDATAEFREFLKEHGIDDVRSLPMSEREVLLEEYLDSRPMVASVTGTIAAVVGIIAGARAIGKGAYEAGQYAAMQANAKRILTKAQYRANSNKYYWQILGVSAGIFGVMSPFVANGFNDWMWN